MALFAPVNNFAKDWDPEDMIGKVAGLLASTSPFDISKHP
jgi:hypothetical protein